MLNLSYSACYDPYNAAFRLSSILWNSPSHWQLTQTLFIADFFLCFPSRLSEVRPPNHIKGMRGRINLALRTEKRAGHELLPSSAVLFERMKVIQQTALSSMAAKSWIKITNHGDEQSAELLVSHFPDQLSKSMKSYSLKHKALLEILTNDFTQIDLKGKSGLRARTGLGEWEYDTV